MDASKTRRRGPTRLRAGLDAGAIAALLGGLIAATSWLRRPGAPGPSLAAAIAAAATGGLLLLALTVALAWRDPHRRQSLGFGSQLPWQRTVRSGLLGALATYAAGGAVALAFVALTNASTDGAGSGPSSLSTKTDALAALSAVPLWAVIPIALFAGFYEEIVFRGFVLRRLLDAFGGGRKGALFGAVIVSSALFATGHAYQGWVGVAQTFVAGICLAVLASRTGSVRACIVAHVAIDTFSLVTLRVLRPWLEQAASAAG